MFVAALLLGCTPTLDMATDRTREGETLQGEEEGEAGEDGGLYEFDEREDSADGGDADGGGDGGDTEDDGGDDGDGGGDDPGGSWVCAEEIRNGSEICDDASFGVPDPYTPLAIYCVTDLGGIGYVSTNTGPVMDDGIARCQGWEDNGMNAWDHLDYVARLTCEYEGQYLEVDLSAYAGEVMWVGVHDDPDADGHFTHVCIAHWE